jgi:hypothetical protein
MFDLFFCVYQHKEYHSASILLLKLTEPFEHSQQIYSNNNNNNSSNNNIIFYNNGKVKGIEEEEEEEGKYFL